MKRRYTNASLALVAASLALGCGSSGSSATPPTGDDADAAAGPDAAAVDGGVKGASDAAKDSAPGVDSAAMDDGSVDGGTMGDGGLAGRSFRGATPIEGPSLPARPVEPFTFHVSDAGDALVIGWHGDVATAPLQATTAGAFATTQSVTLTRPCHGDLADLLDTLTLDHVTLTPTATGIDVTLAGSASGIEQDVLLQSTITADVPADIDTAAPALGGFDSCGLTADQSLSLPLVSMKLVFTEPLAASAAAQLVAAGGGAALPFTAVQTSGPVTSFAGDFAFAFGQTYQATVSPFVDLAGVAGGALPAITTPSVGFVAADGFESTSPIILTSTAGITSDPAVVITGAHSLSIPSTAGFAARLQASAGVTALVANVREVIPANVEGGTLNMAVGVPEGALVRSTQAYYVPNPVTTVTIQAPVAVTIALPPGVNGEVIVQMQASGGSPIFGGPGATFIVDDLKLQ